MLRGLDQHLLHRIWIDFGAPGLLTTLKLPAKQPDREGARCQLQLWRSGREWDECLPHQVWQGRRVDREVARANCRERAVRDSPRPARGSPSLFEPLDEDAPEPVHRTPHGGLIEGGVTEEQTGRNARLLRE